VVSFIRATGRNKRAVEFKFGNISAVLEALGVRWIGDYKRAHHQDARRGRRTSARAPSRDLRKPPVAPAKVAEQDIFINPPELMSKVLGRSIPQSQIDARMRDQRW